VQVVFVADYVFVVVPLPKMHAEGIAGDISVSRRECFERTDDLCQTVSFAGRGGFETRPYVGAIIVKPLLEHYTRNPFAI